MKIAIVEDERLFRDVLGRRARSDLGHEVVGEAGTGREALVVVPAALPDLLVLDIHLPDMDGSRSCARSAASGRSSGRW
jgi:DNA-binding NarL/FixJ family response regulator